MIVPAIQVVEYALRKALSDAAIPVDSVSIGDATKRATWLVQYAGTATDPQKAQGATILATLDPQDPTVLQNVKADLANPRANDELIRAVAQGVFEAIPAPTMTLVQLRNRILAIYRGLL